MEQGSFKLALEYGTHRACFKAYEHQVHKAQTLILFYSVLFYSFVSNV